MAKGTGDLRPRGHPLMSVLIFLLVMYVIVSVAVATATANHCNSATGGSKAWVFAPPHWECRGQSINIGR